ncbi:hypothetical protein EI94DRAFT_1708816 [Lactarius quietus]|nr:hypothetical protein EI94DRAFT_1708816 [Lactarius quietus]
MAECSDLPTKQRKIDTGCCPSPREAESTSQPSRLDIVPVEILAEILRHVTSPRDVLSVARCNKRLRATLLNPSNVMIWRHARIHCVVPGLPLPPPGWSEPTYAAFIFDSGICHICGVSTNRMFFSFVIRVRLCGRLPNELSIVGLRTDLEKATTEYEDMVARGIPQNEYLQLYQAEIQLQNRVLEILSQMENRERRLKSHTQQVRRASIAGQYDRLIKRKTHSVFPPLVEFRGLPIIRALQDREDASTISSDSANPSSSATPVEISRVLKSDLERSQLIGDMIDSDLKQWANTALKEFDAILGQPNWRRASTKCSTLPSGTPKGHATPESLDFRGACAHKCAGHHGKSQAKKKWRASQFVPDQKAIDVLSQALTLLELKAELRGTEDNAEHCRRHDTMQLTLVSVDEAVTLTAGHKYDAGSFAFYTARTDNAKKMGRQRPLVVVTANAKFPSQQERIVRETAVTAWRSYLRSMGLCPTRKKSTGYIPWVTRIFTETRI